MRYYPLNRVKTNQKTAGGEFLLNKFPYKGLYYETYEGEVFTGASPAQGPSQKLERITEPFLESEASREREVVEPVLTKDIVTYNLNRSAITPTTSYQTPQSYYPKPTEDDYARKSFMRYFAKKRNQPGFVIEVDKATHDSLKDADSTYDYVTYESISTFWQLTGPLRDDRTNRQYKVAGIIDTNERLINAKEPSFPGLKAFIGGEYAKFARPTK